MEGSFVKVNSESGVYLIENNKKRIVLSPAVLNTICDQIKIVTQETLDSIEEGMPVTGSVGGYKSVEAPIPKCTEKIPASIKVTKWDTLLPPPNCILENKLRTNSEELIEKAFLKEYPDSTIIEINQVAEDSVNRRYTVDIFYRKGIDIYYNRFYLKPSFDCGLEIYSKEKGTLKTISKNIEEISQDNTVPGPLKYIGGGILLILVFLYLYVKQK